MKKLIHILFGILTLAISVKPALADDWTVGETLQHQISVCLKKEDAIEIVTAHRDKGLSAAEAMWESKAECRTVPVIAAEVGNVVFSARVKVNDEERTGSVVEIVRKGRVIGWFITTMPVHPRPMT